MAEENKNQPREYTVKVVDTDDGVLVGYLEKSIDGTPLKDSPTTHLGRRLYNQATLAAAKLSHTSGKDLSCNLRLDDSLPLEE